MAITIPATLHPSSPLAVRLLSARLICERALRKTQAFAINDEAADPDHLEEALKWLDIIVAEVTGTRRCYWLSPATVTFDWPAGERSLNLADAMGVDYPPTGILFPVRAWAVSPTTGLRECEIELCRRKRYEDHSNLDSPGTPELLFIDRLIQNELAYAWPVPSTDDPRRIALEFQAYARSVFGEQGGDDAGDIPHGFDQTWQLWLITRLAAELGDGPVVTIEAARIRDWRTLADQLLSALLYVNKEKTNRRPVTRRYGG